MLPGKPGNYECILITFESKFTIFVTRNINNREFCGTANPLIRRYFSCNFWQPWGPIGNSFDLCSQFCTLNCYEKNTISISCKTKLFLNFSPEMNFKSYVDLRAPPSFVLNK